MHRFLLSSFFMISIPLVWGGEQLIVVLAPEMNATAAQMTRYEKEETLYRAVASSIPVVLGRNGLGWAQGKGILKYEGDGRSPAGIFDITATFGEGSEPQSAMPYLHADEKLICIDDAEDNHYNQMGRLDPLHPPKSYETMRRHDLLYRNGAVIDYNRKGEKGRGSCIFFHLNRPDYRPTAGCTAMDEQPLLELLRWLDPAKTPRLLQIPISECANYEKKFPGIKCE